MTECDEVADGMPVRAFASLDEAIAHVRTKMPDESPQVVDAVAAALLRRARAAGRDAGEASR